jgi:hypothetical protein
VNQIFGIVVLVLLRRPPDCFQELRNAAGVPDKTRMK